MSLRTAAVASKQDAKASRLDEVIALGHLLKTGANVGANSDKDTRPAHLRDKLKLLKAASAEMRIPKMPDLFADTPISSGTYGFIFLSKCDPKRVFKTSVNHPVEKGCPSTFRHEYNVSNFVQKGINSHITEIREYPFFATNPSKFGFTDTFCFFAMDYIVPLDNETTLIELRPGDTQLERAKGGTQKARPAMTDGGKGAWTQYGKSAAKRMFANGKVPGMDWETYCLSMGRFCALCNFMGILLADVEFIVGKTGSKAGVYVLDFDKVMAINVERIFSDEYREKLVTNSFAEFGHIVNTADAAYSRSQFPHDEKIFNEAYFNQLVQMSIDVPKEVVKQWIVDTGRDKIEPNF